MTAREGSSRRRRSPTLGTLAGAAVFKTAAIDHSTSVPCGKSRRYGGRAVRRQELKGSLPERSEGPSLCTLGPSSLRSSGRLRSFVALPPYRLTPYRTAAVPPTAACSP